jgi:DNA repair protein RadC
VASEKRTIRKPRDAAAIARELIGDADREHVVALLLDARHRVVGVHTVAIGSLNGCPVHPRELFKAALLCNTAAVIVAHNHPSGDLTCSREDIAMTERLAQAGDLLGIQVIDHVIITVDNFVSLRATGAMGPSRSVR